MDAVTEIFGDDPVSLSLFGNIQYVGWHQISHGKEILKSLLAKKCGKNVKKLYLTDIDIQNCPKVQSDLKAKLVYVKTNSEEDCKAWNIKFVKFVDCRFSQWDLPNLNAQGETI